MNKIMKSNTLKFNLPNELSIIKFNGTEEEITRFTTTGSLEVNAICKCNKNPDLTWSRIHSTTGRQRKTEIVYHCGR